MQCEIKKNSKDDVSMLVVMYYIYSAVHVVNLNDNSFLLHHKQNYENAN